jgi:hypothetical protein
LCSKSPPLKLGHQRVAMLTLNFDLTFYHSAAGPTALFEFLGELFELCSA